MEFDELQPLRRAGAGDAEEPGLAPRTALTMLRQCSPLISPFAAWASSQRSGASSSLASLLLGRGRRRAYEGTPSLGESLYIAFIAVVGLAGAAVAHGLYQPWGTRVGRRALRMLARFGGFILLLGVALHEGPPGIRRAGRVACHPQGWRTDDSYGSLERTPWCGVIPYHVQKAASSRSSRLREGLASRSRTVRRRPPPSWTAALTRRQLHFDA